MDGLSESFLGKNGIFSPRKSKSDGKMMEN